MDRAADPTDKELFVPCIDRVAYQEREFELVFKDCELNAVPSSSCLQVFHESYFSRFSRDVTKIKTTKLLILLIFYFKEV